MAEGAQPKLGNSEGNNGALGMSTIRPVARDHFRLEFAPTTFDFHDVANDGRRPVK
jgi:hypothetical protein